MGLIQNLIKKTREKKEKLRQAEDDYEIQRHVADKQLSANERELMSYSKENRERQISMMVEAERKRRLHEWWTGHQVLKEKNIFKGNKNIFKNQRRLFRL